MEYSFQEKSKFALVAVKGVYKDLPNVPFKLSDGTWVMPSMPPTAYVEYWENSLGSLRSTSRADANLVLLAEEASDHPGVLDGVYRRLSQDLALLFWVLHLHPGIATSLRGRADRLCGSCENGVSEIRQVDQMLTFTGP